MTHQPLRRLGVDRLHDAFASWDYANPDGSLTLLGRGSNLVISDRGVRWGETKLVIEMQGGKLHTLREQALHVRYG